MKLLLIFLVLVVFLVNEVKSYRNELYPRLTSLCKGRLQKCPLQQEGRLRLSRDDTYDNNDIPKNIRPAKFTGKGCILLSQPGEFDHFLHRSVILVYNHDKERGSVGVILDRPSPFTVDGAIPGYPEFSTNRLFLGGNDGSDTATIVHQHDIDFSKSLGFRLFVGGMRQAAELVRQGHLPASDFKFIFNTVEWTKGALEKDIDNKRWDVCHLPPDWIVSQDTSSLLWEKCREHLQDNNVLWNP